MNSGQIAYQNLPYLGILFRYSTGLHSVPYDLFSIDSVAILSITVAESAQHKVCCSFSLSADTNGFCWVVIRSTYHCRILSRWVCYKFCSPSWNSIKNRSEMMPNHQQWIGFDASTMSKSKTNTVQVCQQSSDSSFNAYTKSTRFNSNSMVSRMMDRSLVFRHPKQKKHCW